MEQYIRELIYLYRYESLQSALNILYEKYFNSLVGATVKYYREKFQNYFELSVQEIKSISYENFIRIIYTFKLNNFKYTFPQFLFIVNRSYFRDLMLHFINNNGQIVMSKAYQYSDINILSYQMNESKHNTKADEEIILKLLISEIIEYTKEFAYSNFKGETIKIFELWIKGLDPEEFYKQTKFGYKKVIRIIASISRKINMAIVNKFRFNVNNIPLNFCLKIQGF